jgi:hypothetical protein
MMSTTDSPARRNAVPKEIRIGRLLLRNMARKLLREKKWIMLAPTVEVLLKESEPGSSLRKLTDVSNRKGNSDGNVD